LDEYHWEQHPDQVVLLHGEFRFDRAARKFQDLFDQLPRIIHDDSEFAGICAKD